MIPAEIDVNIHPTKSQVKFKSPTDAFRAVSRPLRKHLEKAPWLEDILGDKELSSSTTSLSKPAKPPTKPQVKHYQHKLSYTPSFSPSNEKRLLGSGEKTLDDFLGPSRASKDFDVVQFPKKPSFFRFFTRF